MKVNKKGIFAAAAVLLLAAALFVGAGAAADQTAGSQDELEAAITNVGSGDTITLTASFETGGIKVPSGKNFTLDFAGKTLTFKAPGTGSSGTQTIGFQLLQGSTLTFKNGTIDIKSGNENWSAAAEEAAGGKPIKMLIQNYANLTLEKMVLDGTHINHQDAAYSPSVYIERHVLSNNAGPVALTDSTSITAAAGDYAFDVCKFANYAAPSVTVDTTGTITGKVEVSQAQVAGATGNPELEVKKGTITGDLVIDPAVAKDAPIKISSAAVVPGSWNQNFVAEYSGNKYTTLEAAVAAATSDARTVQKTITVLNDSEGNGIDLTKEGVAEEKYVIDFQGHTYTFKGKMVGSSGTETNGFRIFKGDTVTLKNGTLRNSQTAAAGYTPAKAMINSYGNLTLENMSVNAKTSAVPATGDPYGWAALYLSNGPVKITGTGTYEANLTEAGSTRDCYVILADNVDNYEGPDINFDSDFVGTVSGNIKDTNANPQVDKLTIDAGVFNINTITENPDGEFNIALNGGIFNSDNADTKARLERAITTEGQGKVKINGQDAKTVEIVLNAEESFILTIPAKFIFDPQLISKGDVKLTNVLVTADHAINVTMDSLNGLKLKDAANHETTYTAMAGSKPVTTTDKVVIDGAIADETAAMKFTAEKPTVAGNYNDILTFTGSIVPRSP